MVRALPANSPMRLDTFRIDKMAFQFRPEVLELDDFEGDLDEDYSVNVDVDWHPKRPDAKQFLVRLAIKCRRKKDAPAARFAFVETEASGIFTVGDACPEEQTVLLVPYNCLAILHGLTRGLVASATGCSMYGPYMLPVLNYKALIDAKLRSIARKTAGQRDQEGSVKR